VRFLPRQGRGWRTESRRCCRLGPRLAQGLDTLYASALQGKGAMPARGGNPALADTDVKAAVDHLAAQSR